MLSSVRKKYDLGERMKKKFAVLGLILINTVACSEKNFSAAPAPSTSIAGGAVPSPTTAIPGTTPTSNPLPIPSVNTPPAHLLATACGYPAYAGVYRGPSESSCGSESAVRATSSSNLVSSGVTYRFSIYNVTTLSHSGNDRSEGVQYVRVASSHAANSVDLVLSAYEPTHWVIIGNTAAVRSVHALGYHCADVSGVDGNKISVSTNDNGSSNNVNLLPLSTHIAVDLGYYDGTCAVDRTFNAN